MTRPDFLIIGAAKCATTWLQQALMAQPGIFMPAPELHYFSREYHRGDDWYAKQFSDAPRGALIGEKSNSYLTDPEAAARIARACPDARLVVQLRDPVERAYSDYCMLLRRGEVDADIARHLDPARAANERFLDHGRYAHHLRRYYQLFEPEQILLLAYETVPVAPQEQLARLMAHLGQLPPTAPPARCKVKDRRTAVVPVPLRRVLQPLRPILDPIRHRAPMRLLRHLVAREMRYPPLSAELRREIHAFYHSDRRSLAALAPDLPSLWSAGDAADRDVVPASRQTT